MTDKQVPNDLRDPLADRIREHATDLLLMARRIEIYGPTWRDVEVMLEGERIIADYKTAIERYKQEVEK